MNKRIHRFVFWGLIGACSSTLLGTAFSFNQSKSTTKFFQKLASEEIQSTVEQAKKSSESLTEAPRAEPGSNEQTETNRITKPETETNQTTKPETETNQTTKPETETNQTTKPDQKVEPNLTFKTVQEISASPYLIIREDGTIMGVTREGLLQREIVIPITAKVIGEEAFKGCRNLQKVFIPDTIIRIDKGAFKDCNRLQGITIPENVVKISSDVFTGCDELNENNVISYSPVLFDWWVNNHRYNGTLLKDTREIDLGLYKNSSNKPFTKLGAQALLRCSHLQKIIIPAHITGIDAGNFDTCVDLKQENVINNSPVIFDWWTRHHLYQDETMFSTVIRTMQLDLTRYRNSNNEPFKYIGDGAFSKFHLLVEMNLPESITEIGDSAFSQCLLLKKIDINGKLTKIGEGAFTDCESLVKIDLPPSLTEIGSRAFLKCQNLESIQLGSKIATINTATFMGCNSLQTIRLPEKLQSIHWLAFQGCSSLQSIVLPDTIKEINQHAFASCENLQIVRLPRHLAVISTGLFSNCRRLIDITIPQKVVTIYKEAFRGCSSLEKIVIPKSTKVLGNALFADTHNLKEIYILGVHLDFTQGLIEEINDQVEFYVADFRLISSLRKWGIPDKRIHPIREVSLIGAIHDGVFETIPYVEKQESPGVLGKIKNFFYSLAGHIKDAAIYVKNTFMGRRS